MDLIKSRKKLTPHQIKISMAHFRNLVHTDTDVLNITEINEALAITSKYRESLIRNPNLTIGDVMKQFPALKIYQVVKVEFNRKLNKNLRILEELLDETFVRAANARQFKTPPKLFSDAKKIFMTTKSVAANAYSFQRETKRNAGMLCLVVYLGEKEVIGSLFQLMTKEKETTTKLTPIMMLRQEDLHSGNRKIKIFADGAEILEVPNFYEGVMTVYSLYYIFKVIYDKHVRLLFEYFDHLLGLPQTSFN